MTLTKLAIARLTVVLLCAWVCAGATAQVLPAVNLRPPEARPAQPPPQPGPRSGAAPTHALRVAIPDIVQRLVALRPDVPDDYFLLAEMVAYEAVDPMDVALARQLYVLSYTLDLQKGPTPGRPSSVCLGLRAIEISEPVRDWLKTVSVSLDKRHAATDWNSATLSEVPPELALKATEALGLVRAGEGLRARKLLEQQDVRAVFERYETLLGTTGARGGLQAIEGEAAIWPCPECSNARYVTRLDAQSKPVTRLCGTCHGNPGPRMNEQTFIAHMRFESHLLSGVQQSWAAQIALDQGAPLIDLRLAEVLPTLLERYTIDPTATLWRDGQWTSP